MPVQRVLFVIFGSGLLQNPSYPTSSCTPRIAKTKTKRITMSKTFKRTGIDSNKAFTTIFIPSFELITLRGLRALNDLKPLRKLIFVEISASKIHPKMQKNTIMKSNLFHGSFRYVLSPK